MLWQNCGDKRVSDDVSGCVLMHSSVNPTQRTLTIQWVAGWSRKPSSLGGGRSIQLSYGAMQPGSLQATHPTLQAFVLHTAALARCTMAGQAALLPSAIQFIAPPTCPRWHQTT